LKSAKEVIQQNLELKDILVGHDVTAFREFVETHKQEMCETLSSEKVDDILNLSLEDLSEFMFMWKAQQIYLGESCQQARNHLRRKAFVAKAVESPELLGAALKTHLEEKGTLPNCVACHYFREAPEGEESCMKMGKTLPADSACVGWTPIKN
jgi:hypothetical protein